MNPVTKETKKARLWWDGTTQVNWWETTMNEVTPTSLEAIITVGYIHMLFCIWIYNLHIIFLDEDTLLAFIDISSFFMWPHIHQDLVGAFGFIIGPLFYAANATLFGSIVLATCGSHSKEQFQSKPSLTLAAITC